MTKEQIIAELEVKIKNLEEKNRKQHSAIYEILHHIGSMPLILKIDKILIHSQPK